MHFFLWGYGIYNVMLKWVKQVYFNFLFFLFNPISSIRGFYLEQRDEWYRGTDIMK